MLMKSTRFQQETKIHVQGAIDYHVHGLDHCYSNNDDGKVPEVEK